MHRGIEWNRHVNWNRAGDNLPDFKRIISGYLLNLCIWTNVNLLWRSIAPLWPYREFTSNNFPKLLKTVQQPLHLSEHWNKWLSLPLKPMISSDERRFCPCWGQVCLRRIWRNWLGCWRYQERTGLLKQWHGNCSGVPSEAEIGRQIESLHEISFLA